VIVKVATVRVAVLILAGLATTASGASKDAGLSKLHRGVGTALAGRPASEVTTITRGVDEAFARGADSHELVNLVTDLHKDGVAAPGILNAIEAVGRLAEEGFTDAETRRGVALTVLQNLRDGVRGRELAEAIHDETREGKDAADSDHGGSANGNGGGRSEDAKDKAEVRDELRRNPPPGLSGERGPGGARERSNQNKDKGDKGNDKDKGKPDDAGPKR
jgi:hypothetical protein